MLRKKWDSEMSSRVIVQLHQALSSKKATELAGDDCSMPDLYIGSILLFQQFVQADHA
jgi:hypothetical protein